MEVAAAVEVGAAVNVGVPGRGVAVAPFVVGEGGLVGSTVLSVVLVDVITAIGAVWQDALDNSIQESRVRIKTCLIREKKRDCAIMTFSIFD